MRRRKSTSVFRTAPERTRALAACLASLTLAISLAIGLPNFASANPAPARTSVAFAFANHSGDLLLAPADLPHPERLTKAISPGGRVLRVQYLRPQAARPGDSGRQVSSNFENQAGTVFRVLGGKVGGDVTFLIAEESFLAGARAEQLGPLDSTTVCGAAAHRRLGERQGRPVTNCWPLRSVGRDAHIVLLQFARRGSAALASLALVTKTGVAFQNYPATFGNEGGDLWRVDDGGQMSPEGFEILFALRMDNAWILGVSWASTESLSLSVLVSRDGHDFEELVQGNRYVAPQ